MIHLRRLELVRPRDEFPFTLPVLADFTSLEFETPVTFFVGENGSGKSTLLEILAASLRLPTLTQTSIDRHPLMASARDAASAFRLVRNVPETRGRRRTRPSGFFFRADDVTGYLQSVQQQMQDHETIAEELAASIEGDWGRQRAVGMARGQRRALAERYGENPFARSHGELFLDLFRARITAPGIYLLDEPEGPLSPGNQIALVAVLLDAVERGCQFVVVTHSPILLATPGARIIDVDQTPPAPTSWEDTDHVSLTRAFLANPEAFLRHLREP